MEIEVIQDLIKMDEETRNKINNAHELKYKLKQAKAMYEKESKRITDMFNANKERWIQMIADYTVGKREQE